MHEHTHPGRLQIGYHLSSEEHPPDLADPLGSQAEEAGFDFLTVSDHYHPWTHAQGESPFVWSLLGGLAEATERSRSAPRSPAR